MTLDQRNASFIVASLPTALVGIWNLGSLIVEQGSVPADAWQFSVLAALGAFDAPAGALVSILSGAVFLVPLLVTSLAVSRFWAEVFARLRDRPIDRGWMLWAWLYTLLLPATMPLTFAMLGLSFGVVFAGHVFGGSGRYIVSPALVGVVFMTIAYPNLVGETPWLPGSDGPSSWALVAAEGADARVSAGFSWTQLLLGREIGALGTGSAIACLLGAVALMLRRVAAPRIVAAGCAGVAAAAALGGELPWHWQLVLGNFAFALAFIATDPTIRPRTTAGQWMFGAVFGALTVMLRTANPDHPEGTLAALLLASLCVPLIDRIANAWHVRLGQADLP